MEHNESMLTTHAGSEGGAIWLKDTTLIVESGSSFSHNFAASMLEILIIKIKMLLIDDNDLIYLLCY